MAFIGTTTLTTLLSSSKIIEPFHEDKIKNGAYELSLGGQVFQTDSSPRSIKYLKENEKIEIKPGQFALLLTKEFLNIPKNKIAFISIKAGIKFKGLINVSGFHVDPGFSGHLLFSVYNAGPSNITLSEGSAYFPIWFSELDQEQEYVGSHNKQMCIPNEPVESLSQGELASPNVLSKRIDENKHLKTKIEWAVLVILTLLSALTVKIWTDARDLKNAVEYGYQKKSNELVSDSTINALNNNINTLNINSDSTIKALKENVNSLNNKIDSLIVITNKKSP